MSDLHSNGQPNRWQSISDRALVFFAVVFLLVYSIEVIGNLEGSAKAISETVMHIIWVVFLLDYCVRLYFAHGRLSWFYRHLFDLFTVVLPLLRPLKLLRLVGLVKVIGHKVSSTLRGKIALYAFTSTALFVYVAALAVLDAERNTPDAPIDSFGNALWWAFVTITTVGYGDLYPVTATGRIVALFSMIGGVALIGVVTASIASWIVSEVGEAQQKDNHATSAEIAELRKQILELRRSIEESR
ncbi:ion channel [Trueperella pyogenes]|uniref:ion channel n=1 Tax=Trueperella pyogenes TaxID=1661 RepID=UPI00345D4AAF